MIGSQAILLWSRQRATPPWNIPATNSGTTTARQASGSQLLVRHARIGGLVPGGARTRRRTANALARPVSREPGSECPKRAAGWTPLNGIVLIQPDLRRETAGARP